MIAKSLTILIFFLFTFANVSAQENKTSIEEHNKITNLIANYAHARETKDAVLLKSILTDDVDQLVSSGVWRKNITESMKGMLKSSKTNPGTRTLTVDNVRLLNSENAIVDAKYQIENSNGSTRKMWSTFIVVKREEVWKIAAIRNMLPARP
ncbi:SgcJ/EcaC family oxidoreductase [Aurantibacter sp.]|uniref:SgcJ/EcaC family oxidoreductase n=1 Tax=Aurantibacter sp. TaxID=2807103 RepID=UPI0032638F21